MLGPLRPGFMSLWPAGGEDDSHLGVGLTGSKVLSNGPAVGVLSRVSCLGTGSCWGLSASPSPCGLPVTPLRAGAPWTAAKGSGQHVEVMCCDRGHVHRTESYPKGCSLVPAGGQRPALTRAGSWKDAARTGSGGRGGLPGGGLAVLPWLLLSLPPVSRPTSPPPNIFFWFQFSGSF